MKPIYFSIFCSLESHFFPKIILIFFQRMNYNPLVSAALANRQTSLPTSDHTHPRVQSLSLSLLQSKGAGMCLSLANHSFSPKTLNFEQFVLRRRYSYLPFFKLHNTEEAFSSIMQASNFLQTTTTNLYMKDCCSKSLPMIK